MFAQCLRATIQKVRPALIAEELSEDALRCPPPPRISIAKEIAGGIEHRFCDAPPDKRAAIGYKSSKEIEAEMSMESRWDFPDEERRRVARARLNGNISLNARFWLDCLTVSMCCAKEVVFACGDLHIESGSFTKLLEHEGVPYQIAERRIGVANDEPYYLALAHLQQHPEVLDAPF